MQANATNHLAPEVLRAVGSGALDAAASAAVLAHLDGCVECRQAAVGLMGADFVAQLRAARPPAGTVVEALAPAETASAVPSSVLPANRPNAGLAVLPELREHPQYEVLRELGRGGMGVVYLARNKLMDRPEVLKVVNKQFLGQPETAERFLREIRSAAKLSHTNIVTAYSAVQAGELLAFAMEYVEGEDLDHVVRTRGRLPVANACYYTAQVAVGLQHAFEKGLVHRDIKPQNLILAREGKKHVVKILDFGLAKATREGQEADRGLTGTGMMMGTPDYIAPEQTLDAARADIRADIYSLGCSLYYLLAGNPPFQGKSQFELLQAHHAKEATPLDQVRNDVPVELAAIVAKMMAKDPASRHQKPIEVAQALGPFVKAGLKQLPPAPVAPALTPMDNEVTGARAEKQTAAPAPVVKGTVIEGAAVFGQVTTQPGAGQARPNVVAPLPAVKGTVSESNVTAGRAAKQTTAKEKFPSRQRRGNADEGQGEDENEERPRRRRKSAPKPNRTWVLAAGAGIAGFALLLIVGLVVGLIVYLKAGKGSSSFDKEADNKYTITLKTMSAVGKAETHKTSAKNSSKIRYFDANGGVELALGGDSTKEEEYTETVLERGDKHPRKYKRTYSKSVHIDDKGVSKARSYQGRTVLFAIRADQVNYDVTVEGLPLLAEVDLTELANGAKIPTDKKKTQEESILPGKPVKVNEEWPIIDTATFLGNDGSGVNVLYAKAKLVKVYDSYGKQYGIIEIAYACTTRTPEQPITDAPIAVEGKMTLDLAIDGSSRTSKATRTKKVTIDKRPVAEAEKLKTKTYDALFEITSTEDIEEK